MSGFRDAQPDKHVRPAIADDALAIARIQLDALERVIEASTKSKEGTTAVQPIHPSVEDIATQWRHTLSSPQPQGCHTISALHGRTVVGFGSCNPGERIDALGAPGGEIPAGVDILTFEVDSKFVRQGHGSRLLSALVDITGATCMRVWIRVGDAPRTRFFTSAGFTPAGLRRSLDTGAGTVTEHLWWTLVSDTPAR